MPNVSTRRILVTVLPFLAAFSFVAAFILPIVGAGGAANVSPGMLLAVWAILIPSGVGCFILDGSPNRY